MFYMYMYLQFFETVFISIGNTLFGHICEGDGQILTISTRFLLLFLFVCFFFGGGGGDVFFLFFFVLTDYHVLIFKTISNHDFLTV